MDLRLLVDADTRPAEGKIAKLADRPLKLNLKDSISQPLGRITGQVSEFNKSLEASNARVLAFGASAGAIFAVQRALGETLKSAISVEKALKDINVVLNVSSKSLAQFGDSLFKIAKDTGQSFDAVATAATELARQGLGIEQTLKRTSDALILSRLSGLSTAASVEALTAAINSFSKASINSTQIINKFANVDAAFAVSSADLAEAISRVGSTAQDVGVNLDELIAIVTAAQQTTARGGAVIGNSFKTIFTRLQRQDTLDALEELGISVRDLQGASLPAIQILDNLASTFDTLTKAQQASIAETVGGVFQINILRAALGDLGKEFGTYDSALQTSVTSTDEAIRRNEELNTTLAALVNKTLVNFNQAAAEIGNIVFAPATGKTLDALNSILEAFNQPAETEGAGTKVAKGILSGIGNYLSGPGLAVIGAVFIKLFAGLTAFSAEALKTLLNISSGADKIAQAQSRVNALLAQNPQLIQGILSKELTLLQVEEKILNVIQQQNQARGVAQSIAARVAPRVPVPTRYKGFIPNFADAEIMGARAEGYAAQRSFQVNNPVLGRVTVNNREKTNAVPVGGYPAGSFIVNPKQMGQVSGIPLTPIERMKSKGFIPNFADNDIDLNGFSTRVGVILGSGGSGSIDYAQPASEIPQLRKLDQFKGKRVVLKGIPTKGVFPLPKQGILDAEQAFDAQLRPSLYAGLQDFSNKIGQIILGGQLGQTPKGGDVYSALQRGTKGDIFEQAVRGAITPGNLRAKTAGQDAFDFDPAKQSLINFLGFGLAAGAKIESKIGEAAAENIPAKTIRAFPEAAAQLGISPVAQRKRRMRRGRGGMAGGFVPNFSALQDAVEREKSAGIASGMIRVGANQSLVNNNNPMGLGVYNTRDEPAGLGQGISRKSRGFVPNFADGRGGGGAFFKSLDAASGRLLAFSIALPIVTGTMQKFGDSTSKTAASLRSFSDGLSFAITGLSLGVGPVGKSLGLVAGAALGAYSALESYGNELREINLIPLKTAAEKAADILSVFNGAVSTAVPLINQLIDSQKENIPIAESAFVKIADEINKIPSLKTQEIARGQLETGDLSGLIKTLNDAAAAQERNTKILDLATKVREKDLKVSFSQRGKGPKEGEIIDLGGGVTTVNNQPFINDIYKSFESAASDAQGIISNIFSALNTKEREAVNNLLQQNTKGFSGLLDILTAVSKEAGVDVSVLDNLRIALAGGATNGVKMSEALKKFSESSAKVIKLPKQQANLLNLLPKTALEGAGNILGGKESFINPMERYATQSRLAAGASLYTEGKRRGDVDTQGRGAYNMLSTLVQSGNLTPEAAQGTNLFKSATEARKQQIMQGGKQMEEIYKTSLGKGEKADPEIIKQFQDMQDPLKAQALASQSIKEYLMSDAQKTYAQFAPVLGNILKAVQISSIGGNQEQIGLLKEAFTNRAEEVRSETGMGIEEFYGNTPFNPDTGQIDIGKIDKKSALGKEVAKGTKTGLDSETVQILAAAEKAAPTAPEEESSVNRITDLIIETLQPNLQSVSETVEASKTAFDRVNEAVDVFAKEMNEILDSLAGFGKAIEQVSSDLLNWVTNLFKYQSQSPGGITPPTEDQMGGPVTASTNTNVQGNVTATVNLVGGNNTEPQVQVIALTAAIDALKEEVRVLKAANGEKVPPSQLVSAQNRAVA